MRKNAELKGGKDLEEKTVKIMNFLNLVEIRFYLLLGERNNEKGKKLK